MSSSTTDEMSGVIQKGPAEPRDYFFRGWWKLEDDNASDAIEDLSEAIELGEQLGDDALQRVLTSSVLSSANCSLSDSCPLGAAMSEPDAFEYQERVRRMLRQAFAEVPCPNTFKEAGDCGPLLHDVSLELRLDFYNYEPEEIHYLLPMILEDMMDTRTGDDIETDDAERLVLQLDPFMLDDAVVRKVKLEQFANFTPQQRDAICEWLRFARLWNDLERFTDWVDAAISYWCPNPADNTESSLGCE